MRKKIFFIIIIAALLLIAIRGLMLISSFFPTAATVIFHQAKSLKTNNGKISILLLGIGGGKHDGPDLTDTIIYASLDPEKNTVTLVSIPRDLWIPDLQAKVNTAYADGEEGNKHKGLILAQAVIGKVIGQQIDYGFRIDFQGFVKAIDEVGGIDITVPNTLDDYKYPIEGKEDDTCGLDPEEIKAITASASADLAFDDKFSCRYKHLHVSQGEQHMDGQTALEYVRSRHGVNGEGSDFARSRRQQLVIEAFRNKLISVQTIANPGKIISLYNIVKDSIDTNFAENEFGLLVQLAQKMQHAMIKTAVIDFGDYTTNRPGLLINPPISQAYDFASVLIPRIGDGNFSEIQAFVACEITKDTCPISQNPK